ncbi:hypothetical protein J422_00636 [Methanocaldococcus villosus KIN24-T80]|uniref:DUF2209 domain-containing protein n=1 Tax=Methanocaldococcus villosus KIN24-T80 TaxID=1069083 RepID=N6VS49_9EURY|nr:DUF2209 family protein [Methanocaldococcus villosus]ENN96705.1 hypothetical protein J422_00636 [Methanocaldococcus villosus KIN24-T80]
MVKVLAIDISGRHHENKEFFRVYAGVLLEIEADRIVHVEKIDVLIKKEESQKLRDILKETIELINKIGGEFEYILCEKGEFFNLPKEQVSSILKRHVIYPRTRGEKEAINIAHHVSYSVRKLLLNEGF